MIIEKKLPVILYPYFYCEKQVERVLQVEAVKSMLYTTALNLSDQLIQSVQTVKVHKRD